MAAGGGCADGASGLKDLELLWIAMYGVLAAVSDVAERRCPRFATQSGVVRVRRLRIAVSGPRCGGFAYVL